MAGYKDEFKDRIKEQSNLAEKRFRNYCDAHDIEYYEYGIHNHGFGKSFGLFPGIIRNTPDFITLKRHPQLVEVKGGLENIKIKLNDVESYKKWNEILPLKYFFYSLTYHTEYLIKHDSLMEYVSYCQTDFYPDNNKQYYILECADLESLCMLKGVL